MYWREFGDGCDRGFRGVWRGEGWVCWGGDEMIRGYWELGVGGKIESAMEGEMWGCCDEC